MVPSGPQVTAIRVSPGFRLRPSLSGRQHRRRAAEAHRVAGVQTPAFVERPSSSRRMPRTRCVAGVQTPAFVERGRRWWTAIWPGGVAGVQTPAFVERPRSAPSPPRARCVAGVQTPAFVERIAKNGCATQVPRVAGVQTPAFVERRPRPGTSGAPPCVAGVQTPAFVERRTGGRTTPRAVCVAGVQTPAFVERSAPPPGPGPAWAVSPGFRLRPSLSVAPSSGGRLAGDGCRRGSDSGLR